MTRSWAATPQRPTSALIGRRTMIVPAMLAPAVALAAIGSLRAELVDMEIIARQQPAAMAPGQPPAAPAPAPVPDPTKNAWVLELPGNGFVVGQLGPTPAAEGDAPANGQQFMSWQSTAFAAPFTFAWNGISRIRLPPAAAPAPAANAWRADLKGHGVVLGTLEGIDAEHVTLAAPGVGKPPLRLRRDAVVRLTREGGATRVFVPGGLAGWKVDRKAWREEAGRFAGTAQGGGIARDVAAPPRACYEFTLSWDERPEFEIVLAANADRMTAIEKLGGTERKPGEEVYRIEAAAGGELVVVREGDRTAQIGIADALPAAAGRLRLRAFVDQATGRLAVAVAKGEAGEKPAFDHVVPPVQAAPAGGLAIRLRRGGMRIERLRIHPWTDPEPRIVSAAGLGGPEAAVESFDKATGVFVVNAAGERRERPGTEVEEITFAAENQPTVPTAGVLVVFHCGTQLAGRIRDIRPPAIHLDLPGIAEPVECELGQIAVLENLAAPLAAVLPGREGRLEGPGIRMTGCLTTSADSGIAWQNRATPAANPLAGSKVAIRVLYDLPSELTQKAGGQEQPGNGPGAPHPLGGKRIMHRRPPHAPMPAAAAAAAPPKPFPGGKSLLFLRSGDSLLCTVLSADANGVRIRKEAGGELVVPAAVMRAIELLSAAGQPLSKTKADRLMILPRMQQADPPTHMLRLAGGDYLRGKLLSLDDQTVRFEIAGAAKDVRRGDVTRLIWISAGGPEADAAAIAAIAAGRRPEDVLIRALLQAGDDTRWLTCAADRVVGDTLTGRSGVLGEVTVDLKNCLSIDIGPAAATLPESLPFAQWRLRPAAVPRGLKTDNGKQ